MSYGTGKNARQGKIARLSNHLRDELNQRMLDGQSGRQILGWLNNVPEVVAKLEEDVEGLRVSDGNLSNWRKGGYAEWLSRRERLARTKDLAGYSLKLAEASGGKLSEGAAAILSGRILETLEMLDKLTAEEIGPDGTDKTDPAQLKSATEALASMSESLASLRAGDQNNRRLEQNDEKLALLKARLEQAEKTLQLEQNKFQRLTCAKFVDFLKNDSALKIAGETALTNSQKIEALGPVLFGDLWKQQEEAA